MAELLGTRLRVELTETDFDNASVIWQLWRRKSGRG